MGHKMPKAEAIALAQGFLAQASGSVAECVGIERDKMNREEWVVFFNAAPPGAKAFDPAHIILIVNMVTREVRRFPLL